MSTQADQSAGRSGANVNSDHYATTETASAMFRSSSHGKSLTRANLAAHNHDQTQQANYHALSINGQCQVSGREQAIDGDDAKLTEQEQVAASNPRSAHG